MAVQLSTGATASSGSSQTVINVGGITISVNGSGSIVDDIKNAKGEIADTIMQAIADAVGQQQVTGQRRLCDGHIYYW